MKPKAPIKILQFGEGNFLRAFADYMVYKLNKAELFNGSICVFNLRRTGSVEKIKNANFKYHLISRGIENGKANSKIIEIDSISDAVNPYLEFEKFIELAKLPDLRFVISNSTEAGIALNPIDAIDANPPESFPAKLTLLLYKRFQFFKGELSKGLVILPCELIENNADALKKCILQCAKNWNLPDTFETWVNESCKFCNTLVDRIVSGHPSENEADPAVRELNDPISVVAEPYLLWAIEAPASVAQELPFNKIGLNVIYTNDISAYRQRKVFLLNAPHTLMSAIGLEMGLNTVLDAVTHPQLRSYLNELVFDELTQTLPLPINELKEYARVVLDRFANPYLEHFLKSIAENSIAKCIVREIPPAESFYKKHGKVPRAIIFGIATNIVLAFKNKEKLPKVAESTPLAECYNLKEFTELFARSEYFSGSIFSKNPEYMNTLISHALKIEEFGMTQALEKFIDEKSA